MALRRLLILCALVSWSAHVRAQTAEAPPGPGVLVLVDRGASHARRLETALRGIDLVGARFVPAREWSEEAGGARLPSFRSVVAVGPEALRCVGESAPAPRILLVDWDVPEAARRSGAFHLALRPDPERLLAALGLMRERPRVLLAGAGPGDLGARVTLDFTGEESPPGALLGRTGGPVDALFLRGVDDARARAWLAAARARGLLVASAVPGLARRGADLVLEPDYGLAALLLRARIDALGPAPLGPFPARLLVAPSWLDGLDPAARVAALGLCDGLVEARHRPEEAR